ncbi:ComEC/Rec2 family competence protein [Wenyingzhuangia sp. chi5]|uniref:ComEC/Rec2 family competence protein n=1 Tax=Wenyingzhuangia gilva TaxID=3057677 RepID=A0ABT8VRB5_9FLAO|nr:ComEC/Rec2 family competence protein [Wenyingzhuangia sp. chi5]MDO3694518.1 ComEC/Rec2 family competence protein [Wenyingzhuangia sp. chi5]
MNLLISYIPFQVLLGVLIGILYPVQNIYVICVLPLVTLIMMFLLHRYLMSKSFSHQLFFLLLMLFGMSVSWFSQVLQDDLKDENHYIKYLNQQVHTKITLVKQLTDTNTYQRFYASVNVVNDTLTEGKILIEIPVKTSKVSELQVGDILFCKSNFKRINPPSSPYDFDYKTYLARQDIYAKIKLEHNYIKIGNNTSCLIKLQKLRNKVNTVLESSSLSANTIGLMKAMLLGDKNGVTDEMLTSFTNSGVVHIIAISGMHVGVLYFMLLYTFVFIKRFKYGNYVYVIVVILCLWSFAVFSGMSSSVIRSVTMFSFFTLTKLKSGKRLVLEAIITSMLVLLLYDSNYLFNVGFQLSYSAVISIVVFYPLFSKWIKVKYKIAKYFVDVLVVSVIAQLGVLPFALYYFHQVPLQFLFTNFFAVSLLPVVLYGGIIVLFKLLLFKNQCFIESLYNDFITYYLEVVQYFSSFSNWILKDVSFSKMEIIYYYVFLFCVWYLVDSFNYKRIKHSLFLIIICQLLLLFEMYKENKVSELLIYNSIGQNMITVRHQNTITIFAKDSLTAKDSVLLKANQLKNKLKEINYSSKEVFTFKNDNYLVINKNKPYYLLKQKELILIIVDNPRINLERLITSLKPKQIIIASSNYKNNQLKWKSTCKKLQVPIYCVTELGAFIKN